MIKPIQVIIDARLEKNSYGRGLVQPKVGNRIHNHRHILDNSLLEQMKGRQDRRVSSKFVDATKNANAVFDYGSIYNYEVNLTKFHEFCSYSL